MKTPIERFLDGFKVGRKDKCWNWVRHCHSNGGYGLFKINGRYVRTHRFSFEYYCHKIPEGIFVLHKCDNPPCVNPDHLFLGTQLDNMRDMASKNRHFTPFSKYGENHPGTKLSDGDVMVIRDLFALGVKQIVLSRFLDIPPTTINRIVKRHTWAHLA